MEAGIRICYAKCEPCQFGDHYDEAEWHSWAGEDDIVHFAATGQPDPSDQRCGCRCADAVRPLGVSK